MDKGVVTEGQADLGRCNAMAKNNLGNNFFYQSFFLKILPKKIKIDWQVEIKEKFKETFFAQNFINVLVI